MLLEIAVNNKKWKVHKNPGSLDGAWITAEELGQKLGYEQSKDSVLKIYERHSESFIDKVDSTTVKLTVVGKQRSVRVFSERGALKIIRHSETAIAAKKSHQKKSQLKIAAENRRLKNRRLKKDN